MNAQAGRLIALAAGGTGGHMFPAEALAEELKRRGWGVLLVTDQRGMRYAEHFPDDARVVISGASPSVGGPVARAQAAAALAGGFAKAFGEFRKRKPAAAVGFGGYPSFAAMKAAEMLKIPYGVHEQNSVLGRANRSLVGAARFTAHAFPILEKTPERARSSLVEVGNPVRDAVKAFAGAPYPVESDKIRLLIFGGSQGASVFSRTPPAALAMLPAETRRAVHVVQQARENEAGDVSRAYREAGIACEVAPFFDDLPARIAQAHLVIGRAGASTVTELSVIGRPAILVPLAIAMDDHQSANARVLSEAGGAILLPESGFTEAALSAALVPLLADRTRLAAMAAKARRRVREGAAVALADLVERIARG